MSVEIARPYVAAFSARFMLMLQYRAAAVAGFATQCWWGAIKVMIYAAFYRASSGARERTDDVGAGHHVHVVGAGVSRAGAVGRAIRTSRSRCAREPSATTD